MGRMKSKWKGYLTKRKFLLPLIGQCLKMTHWFKWPLVFFWNIGSLQIRLSSVWITFFYAIARSYLTWYSRCWCSMFFYSLSWFDHFCIDSVDEYVTFSPSLCRMCPRCYRVLFKCPVITPLRRTKPNHADLWGPQSWVKQSINHPQWRLQPLEKVWRMGTGGGAHSCLRGFLFLN